MEEPGGNIMPERTGDRAAEDRRSGVVNFHEHYELWIGGWRIPRQRSIGVVWPLFRRRRGSRFCRNLIARDQRLLGLAIGGGLHQHLGDGLRGLWADGLANALWSEVRYLPVLVDGTDDV